MSVIAIYNVAALKELKTPAVKDTKDPVRWQHMSWRNNSKSRRYIVSFAGNWTGRNSVNHMMLPAINLQRLSVSRKRVDPSNALPFTLMAVWKRERAQSYFCHYISLLTMKQSTSHVLIRSLICRILISHTFPYKLNLERLSVNL